MIHSSGLRPEIE